MEVKYQTKEISDKDLWEKYVLSKNPRSFLQSWNWGETHLKLGHKIFRLGVYKGKVLSGVCLMIGHNARRGRHFTISGGPLIDWDDSKSVSKLFECIKSIAIKENALFVRIRPEIVDSPNAFEIFKKRGFINSPMHLDAENTWIVDIGGSEQDIMGKMRKTTRYMIRKGLEKSYVVYKTNDLSKLDILVDLQSQTVARHKFVGFGKAMFIAELKTFSDDNQAELFVLEDNGAPLVCALVIYYGNYAYYHFSGSSNASRNTPASYVLQWEIIKRARELKKNFYNMWGITKEENTNHRFYGVTVFKKGFGGEQIDWLHAKDLPMNKKYFITYLFETIRKKIRHL